jgi:hypothetical protein
MDSEQPNETSPNSFCYVPLPPWVTRFFTLSFGGYKVAGEQVLTSLHGSEIAQTASIPSLSTMAALKWNQGFLTMEITWICFH